MSILEELLPASYAGVPFLMTRSSVTGGRKDVLKQFPNSNIQKVEDLGLRPRSYNVEICTTSDRSDANYKQQRDRLLQVLEGGQKEKLIHPLYGTVENVVVRSYTIIEDFSAIGDGRLSVQFAVSDSDGVPLVAETSLTDLEASSNSVRGSINNDFVERFQVPSTANNLTAAVAKVQEVVDAFSENVTFFSVAADTIDTFTAQLSNLQTDILQLVNSPQELADSINNLFTTAVNLYNTPEDAFQVLEKFFDFGSGDEPAPTTTVSRVEREQNRRAINSMINVQSLSLAYTEAAQVEFQTVPQVEEAADTLEVQFQTVVTNNTSDINTIFAETNGASVETVDLVTDLRSTTQAFFDEQRLSAKQIIEVRTPVTPARVLAYQYYGDSTDGEAIADLNNEPNVTFLEGEVEIFTE